jgi:TrmH family RNA methyltransferase
MTLPPPRVLQSAQNPLLQRVRKLVSEASGYRRLGQCWLEGEHLATAARQRGQRPAVALLAQSACLRADLVHLAQQAEDAVCIPDTLWSSLSSIPAAQGIGCLCAVPEPMDIDAAVATVVLDRLQDAGNVGSILRSAAALGVAQVVAIRGTAALWSPKVLRAGMGAHWALRLVEGVEPESLLALPWSLVSTSSHGGQPLPEVPLPRPCAWVFGNEGQGVSEALLARCALRVCIPQPGGEESLNAAAAAAICLYEASRRQ